MGSVKNKIENLRLELPFNAFHTLELQTDTPSFRRTATTYRIPWPIDLFHQSTISTSYFTYYKCLVQYQCAVTEI